MLLIYRKTYFLLFFLSVIFSEKAIANSQLQSDYLINIIYFQATNNITFKSIENVGFQTTKNKETFNENSINDQKIENNSNFNNLMFNTLILLIVVLSVVSLVQFLKSKKIKNSFHKLNNQFIEVNKSKNELENDLIELQKIIIKSNELTEILNKMSCGIIIAAIDGEIEWINNGMYNLLDFSFSEFRIACGNNLFKIYENYSQMNEVKEQKVKTTFISSKVSKSGTRYWLLTEIIPFINEQNEIVKYCVTETNVSQYINSESQLNDKINNLEYQINIANIQRDRYLSQNKELTDSIRYAERIQSAIFPSKQFLNKLFAEYFIINKPRDIVSGDFYWITEKHNKIYIVVADCTGHGVPGGFMSILGFIFLNDIVLNNSNYNSAEILDRLREMVIQSLNQSKNDTKDGMDISICVIDNALATLDFAGANNQALLFHNNELIVLKPDRMPIGVYETKIRPFTNQVININSGDRLYMFTDGFVDQFDWRTGKKYKVHRFKQQLADITNIPMKAQCNILENTLSMWQGSTEQVDDILVVGIKI